MRALKLLLITTIASPLLLDARAQKQAPTVTPARAQQQQQLSGRPQGGASVSTQQSTAPGSGSSSVNVLNTTIQVQGSYTGSVPDVIPGAVRLNLHDAIQRGLKTNLGPIGADASQQQASGPKYWSAAEAISVSRSVNEIGAQVIAAHPQQFGVDALLPLPDVDASLQEIEYALDVLKLDGVGLSTNYGGVYLGDAKFRPVFEELNRRKAVVFVHPVEPVNFDQIGFGFPAPMLEYPFETTRMIASLLRGGVIKDLPDIRFITTHGGGAVPFLGPDRMSIIIPMTLAMEAKKAGRSSSLLPKDVLAQLKTLYFDVAAATIPPYLLALKQLVSTSQLLTGFDFPFMPVQSIPPAIDAVQDYDEFSKADKEDIFGKNALSLYPRLAPKD